MYRYLSVRGGEMEKKQLISEYMELFADGMEAAAAVVQALEDTADRKKCAKTHEAARKNQRKKSRIARRKSRR